MSPHPSGQAAPDLTTYDHVIVAFSGGKDSAAAFLETKQQIDALPEEQRPSLELWHQDVDGRPTHLGGDAERFIDWPVTADYCVRFGEAFDTPVYFQWKEGGFEGEMLREDSLTNASSFETPEGIATTGGTRGKPSTRMLYPQISPDLSVRWCSAYLKIDVAATALRHQDRFNYHPDETPVRVLFVTGERAEEAISGEAFAAFRAGDLTADDLSGRAAYAYVETHRADLRNGKRKARHIDHWRPVHHWSETEVWAIIEAHNVNPHPAYKLGWGRCSCMGCIFNSKDHFATMREIAPAKFETMATYEGCFERTMKRDTDLRTLADSGTAFDLPVLDAQASQQHTYREPIIVPQGEWTLPLGAFAEGACGAV